MTGHFKKSKIGDFIRWKLEPKKIIKFISNHVLSVFGGRNYAKFIILTRSRTGSNLLLDYLNSHKQIFARSEIFRHLKGREYQAILRSIFRKHPFFTKAAGFKIFYNHPLDARDRGVWNALEKDRTIRVIHLVRNNVLRSIVSHQIADKMNFWCQKRRQKKTMPRIYDKRIHLDGNELLKEFSQTEMWQLQAEARFRDHKLLKISYEELARDPEASFAKVCCFLGVAYRKPESAFRKQNPEKLIHLIENYAELKEMLRESKWQEYFEEE